ncbi:hypothetical protein [Wenyingzhuangia sp. IMCC45574]
MIKIFAKYLLKIIYNQACFFSKIDSSVSLRMKFGGILGFYICFWLAFFKLLPLKRYGGIVFIYCSLFIIALSFIVGFFMKFEKIDSISFNKKEKIMNRVILIALVLILIFLKN